MKTGFWKFIDEVASRSDFRPTLEFWRDIWPSLAGEELARRSSPCGWHGSTLIVEIEPGAWRNALESSQRLLEKRLEQLPWEVTEVRFEDGHVEAERSERSRPERHLEAVEIPEADQRLLAEGDLDPEIAELAGRIRRHLEWEKNISEPVDSTTSEE